MPSLSNQPTTEPGQKRGRSLSVPSVIQFIVQVSALLLGCGYHLARSPARPRSLRTRAESRVLTPVPRIPQAPPPRQPGQGQKQSHNPVPERSRWGEKQSTPPPQDREKAGGASFPRRNFVSEKHDVGDAYSDGRMSPNSWAPGSCLASSSSCERSVASGTKALMAAGGRNGSDSWGQTKTA